jgi:hypothetical protein
MARMAFSSSKPGARGPDRVRLAGIACAAVSVVGAGIVLIVRPIFDGAGLLNVAAALLGIVAAGVWAADLRRAAPTVAPGRPTWTPAHPMPGTWAAHASATGPWLAADQATAPRPAQEVVDDPLFAFPPTGAARAFIQPKEGEPLRRCQDFFAADPVRGIFAVTDGVSTAFLPRPWASIVARAAVSTPGALHDETAFRPWLDDAAAAWRDWVVERWLPAIQRQQTARGEMPANYGEMIDDKGAQTTLILCEVTPTRDGARVLLTSIGDAVGLHARRTNAGWTLADAFPVDDPDHFGVQPATLPTRADPSLQARAWRECVRRSFTARSGDRIILATDTMAEWILRDPPARLEQVVALATAEDFELLIERERQRGVMKDDDMTVLIVPIPLRER